MAAFCGRVLGPATQAWPSSPDASAMLAGTDHLAERVARNLVYAPAYTLMGGTTQILRTILADRVLALPRI